MANHQNNYLNESIPAQHSDANLGVIFLPTSLVKLVLKVANLFNLTSYDEFSLLDTIEVCLNSAMEKNEELDEQKMTILIINIIRVTEKFNKASSEITKAQLETIFKELSISSQDFNRQEFETFKAMKFHVMNPHCVEAIYKFIEMHLPEFKLSENSLFELSLDVLRFVYALKCKIYKK